MNQLDATLHPEAAEIVRWMDGALSPPERAALEKHVGKCVRCSTRRAAMMRRSAQVSEQIRAVDVPTPATPLRVTLARPERLPAWWRAAAVIVLGIAGAVAVPPVRAWIADAARAVWAAATGPGLVESAPAGVAFVPAGPVLTIHSPARDSGSLTVEVVDGERVTMIEAGGRELPRVTVLPDELRIGEGSDSAAHYLVRVPIGLEAVRIVVDGGAPEMFRPSVLGERRAFTLRKGPRAP